MADFCKQCSEEMFGEDYEELANLGYPNTVLALDEGYPAICEGCGFIRVDVAGQCLGDADCLRKHKPPTTKVLVNRKEPKE